MDTNAGDSSLRAYKGAKQPGRCVSTSSCRVRSHSPSGYASNMRVTSSQFIRCLRTVNASELTDVPLFIHLHSVLSAATTETTMPFHEEPAFRNIIPRTAGNYSPWLTTLACSPMVSVRIRPDVSGVSISP
jgi:hypothetical protein